MTFHARTTYDVTCDGPGCLAEVVDVDTDDDLPDGWTVREVTEDDPDHFPGAMLHRCPSCRRA